MGYPILCTQLGRVTWIKDFTKQEIISNKSNSHLQIGHCLCLRAVSVRISMISVNTLRKYSSLPNIFLLKILWADNSTWCLLSSSRHVRDTVGNANISRHPEVCQKWCHHLAADLAKQIWVPCDLQVPQKQNSILKRNNTFLVAVANSHDL